MKLNSKSSLAVSLSKLKGFEIGKVSTKLEQYQTDPEIAAEIIWFAYMKGDISGKVIVDLGCGTGVLGIGALLLGAKKVIFVDIDNKVVEIAKENLKFVEQELEAKLGESQFIVGDISKFQDKADIVLQNPPFGTKQKHADKAFLEKAVNIAPVVYSFHKIESKGFIDKFAVQNQLKITHFWNFDFPLKMTMKRHKRKIHRINVGCWRLEKLINN
jgi:putative methylase